MRVPVGEPRLELIEGSVAPEPVWFPATMGEEIWQLVQEWYATRGEPIPEEDRTECMRLLEEERVARDAPLPVATAAAAPAKPAYGTPEFWKAHWAKKRAQAQNQAQATNPSAPVPPTRTAVPKAKPPPKTPVAKATAQVGATPGQAS